MQFRILGPLEAWDDGRRVPLGGPQQRGLLALLLLNANRVVATDRLVESLWDGQPPATARGLLQGCVAQLRRALGPGNGKTGRQPLVTRAPGYLLEVPSGDLDLDRFEELARRGRQEAQVAARHAGQPAGTGAEQAAATWVRAADMLTEALSLWRGPALDGIDLPACRVHATALDERRLVVWEERIEIDLRLSRAAALVPELQALVGAYPLRERLWALLMLALYAADRQADALAAYRELRRTLVDQLGVEPGGSLRGLHQLLLSGGDVLAGYFAQRGVPHLDRADAGGESAERSGPTPVPTSAISAPAASPPAVSPLAVPSGSTAGAESAAVVPAQLPGPTAAFVGRIRSLKRLDELLNDLDDGMAIGVVSGTAGVGKTTLAVHWAHQVRDRFPDGQLYVDLRGHAAAPPLRPLEVLAGFLPALGVPAREVPDTLDRAAAQYRSLLADRRILVVLDNAESAEQVRPLLPGSPGCVVLVTSRGRLGGLVARDGARHHLLDVLDPGESRALLARLLGEARIQAEPRAAVQLTQLCAHLPLALRIAAAHLTIQRGRTLTGEVAELSAGNRLAALEVDGDQESAVRAAFDRSYTALDPEARRLFQLLGLVPCLDFTAETAATLADTTPGQAAGLLEILAGAHLLGTPVPGRYSLHDLLRLYAAERAVEEMSATDRGAAAGRLLSAYLVTADAADRLLNPDRIRLPLPEPGPDTPRQLAAIGDHTEALAWLDAERFNLAVGVRHAAEHGPRSFGWLLAHTLHGFFNLRMHTVDWRSVSEAGLAAAEADGSQAGQAAAYLSLGTRYERQGDYPRAEIAITKALAFAEEGEWLEGQAVALSELGIIRRHAGRLQDAADYFTQAVDVARRSGPPTLVAGRLVSLGNLYAEAGQLEKAADYYTQVLPLFRQVGSRGREAVILGNLGECCVVLGRLDEALDHFTNALTLNREIGHRGQAADNLRALATAHCDAGSYAEALELARSALSGSHETGDRRFEADALNTMGTVYQRLANFGRAADHHRRALQLSRDIGVRQHEVAALIGLAHSYQHLGDSDQATTCAEQALLLARQDGFRLLEGPARTAIATVKLAQDRLDESIEHATEALDVHRSTGHRLGEARTLLILGGAQQRSGETDGAAASWRQALRLFVEVGAPEAEKARSLLAAGTPSRAPA
jgi:DNA-binding SARP family transcriptional activator/tetratricopeptide (TPR) repeat protein